MGSYNPEEYYDIPNDDVKETPTMNTTTPTPDHEAFYRAASRALVKAAKNPYFTSDDIWAEIPAEVRVGVEPRALGGVLAAARKGGFIVPVDKTVPSKRPECHRRPIRVWASLNSK